MNINYKSEWWTIQIPEQWDIEEDEECVSFLPPSQESALQVSTNIKSGEDVSLQDLLDFATDQSLIHVSIRNFQTEHFNGIYREYVEDDTFWRQWYLSAGNVMIFATYNINANHQDLEKTIIDAVIKTMARG